MTYRQEYYKKNKERVKEANRIWKKNNKEKTKEWYKEYHKTHKDEYRARHKKYRLKVRNDVINHYGGKCACCGENTLEFMTIDHIENNGAQHRKQVMGNSRNSGWKFYKWLRQNNYPKEFQVLCFNCNMGRSLNNGICPHKNG